MNLGAQVAAPVGGTYTVFDVPSCNGPIPAQINSSAAVVGWCDGEGFVRDSDGKIKKVKFPGASATDATSINDAGDYTGYYLDGTVYHGYIESATGGTTIFDVPGAVTTAPMNINNAGVVSGYYEDTAPHGFVRLTSGEILTYDIPDAAYIRPVGLNEKGFVAGYWQDADFNYQPYIWSKPWGLVNVTPPGLTDVMFQALNDSGAVLGTDPSTSFLMFHGGTMKRYQGPGAFTAYGFNNQNVMVGITLVGLSDFKGIVQLPSGRYFEIIPPDAIDTFPVDINDNNQILGSFDDSGHRTHCFVLTPMPEALQNP